MQRVIFDGCAGWLHGSTGPLGPRDTGVVLCSPLGHEAVWSHRAWRHLADQLAAAGVPALRFDYAGTGDSADVASQDPMVRAVADIEAGAALLRRHGAVEKVVLCGLRMGACLAAMAATRVGASGLVMLSPVADGRAYLRELRALHAGWRNSAIPELQPPPAPAGDMDVLSFRMPAATVEAIQALRLDRLDKAPAPHVLLLDAGPEHVSPAPALLGQFHSLGAQVRMERFDEYPMMMRSAEFADVPSRAWAAVVGWVAERSQPNESPHESITAVSVSPPPDTLLADGMVEQPVRLGNGRLFGILCTPERAPADLVVIFPNTGGNHHVGDGRIFVELSRRLAREGVAALRLDVSLLGDSLCAARTMDLSSIYSRTARHDVSLAVDGMRAHGYRRIVLAGVCSGAFLSLHAALANPNVTGVVLANLVKFRWDAADEAEASDDLRSARVYLAAACKWENWRRLLSGRLDVARIVSATLRRIRHRARAAGAAAHTEGGGESGVSAFACGAVRELNRRGVRTDFVYGASDVGLREVRLGFGRQLEAIASLPSVDVRILPMLDHSLFLVASREAFAEQLLAHVARVQDSMARQLVRVERAAARNTVRPPRPVRVPARVAQNPVARQKD
ncbi:MULTISPECIES: serine aminopeptidase domain-containing protein [unclassified Cupriavidus]|uniref:serine aminopeptidase domain-containing protein n=1 Tax=unclassified Cupriavidus TaxID=2640874 RepID=UPI00313AFE70